MRWLVVAVLLAGCVELEEPPEPQDEPKPQEAPPEVMALGCGDQELAPIQHQLTGYCWGWFSSHIYLFPDPVELVDVHLRVELANFGGFSASLGYTNDGRTWHTIDTNGSADGPKINLTGTVNDVALGLRILPELGNYIDGSGGSITYLPTNATMPSYTGGNCGAHAVESYDGCAASETHTYALGSHAEMEVSVAWTLGPSSFPGSCPHEVAQPALYGVADGKLRILNDSLATQWPNVVPADVEWLVLAESSIVVECNGHSVVFTESAFSF